MRLRIAMKAAMIAGILLALSSAAVAQDGRKVLARPTPVYPEVAKRMALRGTVKIEITIGADGEIKHTNVIGGHPILVDAALDALKKWKYEPTKAETTLTVQFDFHP
jgi:TonB family protein